MFRSFTLLLFLSFCVWGCIQVTNAQRPSTNAIPALQIRNDTGSYTLQISRLSVDVVVVGNIATTTFDITFQNPLDKILEGEFEFPLADGQNISRYALDINGKLREGVVVEKAKARVAFENTVRKGIDPGLVEKTKGNYFRTRIYPIPARGTKRVVIGIEQTLGYVNKELYYQLPLYTPSPIKNFSLKASVLAPSSEPEMEDGGLDNFDLKKKGDEWTAELSETDFVANNTITISIPYGSSDNFVFTEDYNGKTWFYMNAAMHGENRKKAKPASIVLLWDVSSSAERRNIAQEAELVQKYLSALQNVVVTLVPFHIAPQPKETFTITNGDASALIKRLKQFVFDGGTQLGATDLNSYQGDEIFLFSDGLSTFGKDELVLSAVPVTAVNSSPAADFSYLKHISAQTHGKFIDLSKMETAAAMEDMATDPLQIVRTSFNAGDVEEVYTEKGTAIHDGFSVAGILKNLSATVTVYFNNGTNKVYNISKKEAGKYGNVKRMWAAMKIAELDLRYEKNKESITQLGKQFSIVTQNTSLLVLDRVEDYAEYEIVPPVELQKEYYAIMKEKQKEKKDEKATAMSEATGSMKELTAWWNKKHDLAVKKKKMIADLQASGMASGMVSSMTRFTPLQVERDEEVRVRVGSANELAARAPHPNLRRDQNQAANFLEGRLAGVSMINSSTFTYRSKSNSANAGTYKLEEDKAQDEKAFETDIKVNEWKSNATYLKTLQNTTTDKYFEKYKELKKQYGSQPAFFVDAARFFYEKKNNQLALQVLSNICEMKLEDAELLRIVANQLLEAGETALAIETFKQVLKIREEEPQAYRDLALAYNEAGQYDTAVSLLYKVVTGSWSNRFRGLTMVALNEMNAIISAHPGEVNTARIDKRFIVAMPVDVRIVIGWSSDNSDVDLWVTEPGKEKCTYQNPLTQAGGRLSGDITQGYGPEEYIIKKASNGKYVIEANLYGDTRQTLGGPITVKAELFTNFGRPSQKRKVINFRVTTNKEVVKIGELKFGE